MLRAQSKLAELAAPDLQKIRHKQPVCLQKKIFKRINKSTISAGSTKYGEHDVSWASNDPALPENINEIGEQKQGI